jgi:DNA-binding response OmpR family regulator
VKVLVADDEATSRLLLSSSLEKWGYEVVTASDGAEAWGILREEEDLGLAILDWMMPGLDGVEVCEGARAVEPLRPLYLILVTSRDRREDVIAGLEAGADDYITKPYEIGILRARVEVGARVIRLQQDLKGHVRELEDALAHVKTLQGILPICMHCHKIRNDSESWQRLEAYLSEHSDAQFSHGICPECRDEHYPDVPR